MSIPFLNNPTDRKLKQLYSERRDLKKRLATLIANADEVSSLVEQIEQKGIEINRLGGSIDQ
jgi:shikimate kinase